MRDRLSSRFGTLALAVAFITVGLGSAKAQTITSLSPSSVATANPFPTVTLQVNGSGFAPGAVVQWNGSALTTTFVSSTQLTAVVPHTLYEAPGTATVTVEYGGATSNSAIFTIV